MKNIMFIAVATLTIATANAGDYNWKQPQPLQIVNNTNVTLEFRTEPDNLFITIPSGTTAYGLSSNEFSTYLGWGINSSTGIPPSLNQAFDKVAYYNGQYGTITSDSVDISGNITYGQVWALDNVGYNGKLVLTGTASGNTMQLTATRTQGVVIVSGDSSSTNWTRDIFCLDSGVEITASYGDAVKCPIGETRVVLASDYQLTEYNNWGIHSYDAAALISSVNQTCTYNGTSPFGECNSNSNTINGVYLTGFAPLQYTGENSIVLWPTQ